MALAIYGFAIAKGVVIGRAHLAHRTQLEIAEHKIPDDQIGTEIKRFRHAVRDAREELKTIREQIPENTPNEVFEFIDIHALMLEDGTLSEAPAAIIAEQSCNAEWALQVQRNELAAVFEDMEDAYLASRLEDIDQVIARIQKFLAAPRQLERGAGDSYRGLLLVADELSPADLSLLHHEGVAGLVVEHGGPLSHTAILARGLKIPTVMGVPHARQMLREGEELIIDGDRGVVIGGPDRLLRQHYRRRIREARQQAKQLRQLRRLPCATVDGTQVSLQANVDMPEDVSLITDAGASGVGLFRTEYLYMNRAEPPTEEEQFESYSALIKALKGKPVTIRTLDAGADKPLPNLTNNHGTLNPALGLRAIRLCLTDADLFRPQLRAILRASRFGPVRILIPMLSNSRELFQVKHLIGSLADELKANDEPIGSWQLGGMIEVPAAAIAAHTFAKNLDFLSIGTNDLIQYTLAIDRVDEQVGYLYDPLHPAVLKLLQWTLDAAHKVGTPVSLCGEMAGEPAYTRLLLGLGLREFSMQPGNLLEVKQVVNSTDLSHLKPVLRRLTRSSNPQRTLSLLRELNEL